ncbi:hypothetical protein HOH87_04225 [bacterium]|jgi:hypothetical protein|nr:hypothetical protein [bacterium]
MKPMPSITFDSSEMRTREVDRLADEFATRAFDAFFTTHQRSFNETIETGMITNMADESILSASNAVEGLELFYAVMPTPSMRRRLNEIIGNVIQPVDCDPDLALGRLLIMESFGKLPPNLVPKWIDNLSQVNFNLHHNELVQLSENEFNSQNHDRVRRSKLMFQALIYFSKTNGFKFRVCSSIRKN